MTETYVHCFGNGTVAKMTIQDDPPSLNVEWDGPVNRSDKEYLRWLNASIEDWAEKWYGANRHQPR